MTSDAQPAADKAVVELRNDRAAIDRVQKSVLAGLERHGYPEAARFAVRLALEEAVANAFKHGHRELPDETPVTVEYRIGPGDVEVVVEDQGPGFDPDEVPDPTLEANLEVPSGRGLLLMRAYMGDVRVEGRGNRVVMRFRRDPQAV